jgi:antitoxin (DNA-binding transcriptional repressor) of toxin-antitoxin stability system
VTGPNAGEEIIISKSGQPYARLVALPGRRPKRESGTLKDFVELGGAFFEPLPPDWTGETPMDEPRLSDVLLPGAAL